MRSHDVAACMLGTSPGHASGRDERGFTAVEWLLIALGVITIAGIAVAAVQVLRHRADQQARSALGEPGMALAESRGRDERGARSRSSSCW